MRFLCLLLACSPLFLCAQSTLVEQLGYPKGSKLLIIHADDLGVTHGENAGSFAGMEHGLVTSGSMMAPCPWLPEVAEWARRHPDHDLGMHLTLTSEWGPLKWGPVAGAARVPSLVDSLGYFHAYCADMAAQAQPEEVKLELRAQIEQAIGMGIRPTHLDTHMGCLVYTRPAYFEAYLSLSREYNIPALLGRQELQSAAFAALNAFVHPSDLVIDHIYTATPEDYSGGLARYYTDVLRHLSPGVSTILIHCARNGDESAAAFRGHDNWGADWRQTDTDFFTARTTRALLDELGIRLVTWRELNRRWQAYLKGQGR